MTESSAEIKPRLKKREMVAFESACVEKWCKEIEKAKNLRPLGKPLDAVTCSGKELEEIGDPGEELQICLTTESVLKRI